VLAVPLTLAVAACSGGGGTGSAGPAATIVVGTTLSLTGSLDALGPAVEAGYQQEIADVNAAGGVTVGGTKEKLRLVVLDNRSDPGTADSQASQLVRQDHAVALLGYATAQIVLPVATAAEQLGVPFLTSQLPVETFSSGDKTGWTYSWDLFSDEQQQATDTARALAAVPGDKKVALFTDSEPDAAFERPLYTAAFKAAGLDVVGDYTFPAGTGSFSSSVGEARAAGAQLVAGQMDPADGTALWRQLKSAGLDPRAAFLATGSGAASPPRSLGSLAQDTLSDSYWSSSEASPGQLAKITPTLGKKYAGSPDYPAAALSYAVAEVLTDALARSGSVKPGPLNTAISKTDARTAAGTIEFSQSTHTATTPTFITQSQNGTLVQVQPLMPGATFAVPAAGIG
jgi:branched-chain amino acid transport system substrate-binding protein